MKSKIILLLLGMVALIATVVACSDNPSFGGQDDQNKELILKAKSLVQAQGNAVSLPIPDSQQQNQARSTSYLADLTPLWNNAITYKSGDETILIVPLQSDEEIRSKMLIKQGGETSYQFAKTFSRLIVKGEQAYVLTYMPESEYASTHSDIENELKYNPTEVNFTGMIVTSKLNGSIIRGYIYKNGQLEYNIAPRQQSTNENNLMNNNQNSDFVVKLNLHTNNEARSTSYTKNSEIVYECPNCHMTTQPCKCSEFYKCEQCGMFPEYCLCDWKFPDKCPKCGLNKDYCNCENEECPICKQVNCICNNSAIEPCKECGFAPCRCEDTEPNPIPTPIDTCDICNQEPCACCDICGTYPCVCVTNTYPVNYVAHDNDFLIGEESAYQSSGDCCAMAVVAMAHRAYGAETTESDMSQLYTQLNNMSPEEPTILDVNSTFMTLQFDMGTTTNLAQTALSNVIIVRNNNHYLLVVGVQYDGDLIYADPHNGGLYVVNASYFSGCDNIVIYGNGGKSLKTINQDK